MAETPTPQTLDLAPGTAEIRAEPASSHRPTRSVSAFSPAISSRPPPPGVVSEEQKQFVNALRQCDVVGELRGEELGRVAALVEGSSAAARRLDVLVAYYAAAGRTLDAERRRATDRWYLHSADPALHAGQVLSRLCGVAPELQEVQLVRLGSDQGALVLRSGEDVCALEDARGPEGSSVAVRDIVRAINVLLDRKRVRVRLLGLRGDGQREAYLGQSSMTAALSLLDGGYLCAESPEELMDLCAW